MHLGNAFAALGAWLGARAAGNDNDAHSSSLFLLRIEDIDTPRAVPDADRWIMDDLAWLGLDWDGEVVYQSQRTEIYERVLRGLSEQRLSAEEYLTYPCYCTRAQLRAASAPQESDGFVVYPGTCRKYAEFSPNSEQHDVPSPSVPGMKSQNSYFGADFQNGHFPRFSVLEAVREGRNPAVRMAMPRPQDSRAKCEFCDLLFGNQRWNLSRDVGDIVLRRSDGLFAYQLAVVVDDYLQGVNQIVRGRDLLRSTAAQMWLRQWVAQVVSGGVSERTAFGAAARHAGLTDAPAPAAPIAPVPSLPTTLVPEYAHLPLLLSDTTHARLAKRDHSLELSTLRESGVAPERIIGYLGYLMGITATPEPRTPAELLPAFSWETIRAAGLANRQTDPSILAQ
jgi:glutamyl-tRNA synthetase